MTRKTALSTQDGKPKDLSKGNSFLDVAIDSMRRLFTKSEDEYPSMNDPNAMGFTMTPKKGTAGKVAVGMPPKMCWHPHVRMLTPVQF